MAKKTKAKTAEVVAPVAVIEAPANEVIVAPANDQFSNLAECEKFVARVVKTGRELQSDIDKALRWAAIVAVVHSNISPLKVLYEGTKTLCHQNTIALWIEKHTCAVFSASDKTFKFSSRKRDKMAADLEDYKIKVANAVKYHEMAKPQEPFKGFDFEAELKKLIGKARAYREGHTPRGDELSEQDMVKVKVPMALLGPVADLIGEPTSVN